MRLIGGRNFNPRARVGRDQAGSPISQNSRYFNPRARVGRDARHRIIDVLHMISIHAPAWGATGWKATAMTYRVISIHAPAWGATELSQFESMFDNISIHAPAWGATSRFDEGFFPHQNFNPRARVGRDHPCLGAVRRPYDFNPRARVGRDHKDGARTRYAETFQSTRPRGARRPLLWRVLPSSYFNPRARVGRD